MFDGFVCLENRNRAFRNLRSKTDIGAILTNSNTLVAVPDNIRNLREDVATIIFDFFIVNIRIEEIIRTGPTDDSCRFPGFDNL